MPIQQTFAIIKPDAVANGHTGQILGMIQIAIVDDAKHEHTERFTVKLDGADFAGIARNTATVTIVDND